LQQAEDEALEMGMRPIVWQARAVAANALQSAGRTDASAEKRAGARSMAQEIAELFEDPDLRTAFLDNVTTNIG
jgi:hypothetical protein